MKYSITTGTRYRALIALGFFEKYAGNDTIAAKLRDAGFVDVIVTGSGSGRVATGEWGGASQTADLPDQIQKVEVLK